MLGRCLAAFGLAVLWTSSLCSQEQPIAGTYRCESITSGKLKRRCPSPPLVLNSDGSYQLWNEQGTFMVLDKYVVLSDSRKRGPGLLKGREIVFEYWYKTHKITVNFRRIDKPAPGASFTQMNHGAGGRR